MTKKGTIKQEVAFKALVKGRKERLEREVKYGVFRLTTSGTWAKQPTITTITLNEAEEEARKLMRLNPSKKYTTRKLR